MLYPCKQCDGSIDSRNGICMDCGFDEMQFCSEWEAYVSDDDVSLDPETRMQYMHDRRADDEAARDAA